MQHDTLVAQRTHASALDLRTLSHPHTRRGAECYLLAVLATAPLAAAPLAAAARLPRHFLGFFTCEVAVVCAHILHEFAIDAQERQLLDLHLAQK